MKHIQMTREQHQLWDTALRSGEYIQGKEFLKTTDGKYCCFGVLQMALDGKVQTYGESSAACAVPTQKWLQDHGIKFFDNGQSAKADDGVLYVAPFIPAFNRTLIGVNDDLKKTFIEIADAIAEEVEYIS